MNLVNKNRIDLVIGILYTEFYLKNYNTTFHKDLYLEHKRVWNGLKEKHFQGEKAFIHRFNSLIESINKEKKNLETVEVWNINNYLWVRDGFHRISILHYLNLQPNINIVKRIETDIYKYGVSHMCPTNIYFFKQRGLNQMYCDFIMKTYLIKHVKNFNCIVIFPNDLPLPNLIDKESIIYEKQITNYTKQFAYNLIQILYYDEKWCFDGGFLRKAPRCFNNFGKPLRILFTKKYDSATLIQIKENLRQVYNKGKDSVHTPDTQEENNNLLMLLNHNTLDLMNKQKTLYNNFENFKRLLQRLKIFCSENHIDTNYICITSSAVLSIYNIRDCADIDLFIDKQYETIFSTSEFDNHNCHTIKKYYPLHFEDIIHNPNNHFLFLNFKVCKLDIIYRYKKYRITNNLYSKSSTLKDINDVKNIEKILIM